MNTNDILTILRNNSHGGDVRKLAAAAGQSAGPLLDFSANINPLGPPDWLRLVLSAAVSSLVHYPDPDCTDLREAAAARYGVDPAEVVAGNGSTELLYLLPRLLAPDLAIVPVPSYIDYVTTLRNALPAAAEDLAIPIKPLALEAARGFVLDFAVLEAALEAARAQGAERPLVMLGQPNNPTGRSFDPAVLRALALRHPGVIFIVDEAFADFVEGLDRLTNDRPPNVIVLLSLTNNFAIPGLRLGLAVMERDLAARFRALVPMWSVNTLAQVAGEAALRDGDYLEKTRAYITARRTALATNLGEIQSLTVYPGEANFLLCQLNSNSIDAPTLSERLLRRGIAIRVCENFDGLDAHYFRVAVRTEPENLALCHALSLELDGQPDRCVRFLPRRARPAIMFQGTSSNAGKSILTAALCRIMLQDGWRVAPFKAQNMSLNSFVTRNGGEMGRAQVVQAQAARLDPDVRMNPILLKPNSDTGSQIILCGRPIGNMAVIDYFAYKAMAFEKVKENYDSLAAEFDAIVLEGAGSPAEVNLKAHDIVNMNMARHAQAPVLLVGDIDRGGIFASFIGSMETFTETERALVAGFIVNRFRGKESLLGDALDYTWRATGKPVLGVVPYLRDLGLPEEDSVGFKEGLYDDTMPGGRGGPGDEGTGPWVDIALIDLPYISNFTDIEPLRIEPDVRLRIVRTAAALGAPDAIILPGSKNVIGDLHFLRDSGLDEKIVARATDGGSEIVGICGGFQMLGQTIADPHRIETESGAPARGLGLMRIMTTLERDKTLARVRARHVEAALDVVGYEIHHGQTRDTAALGTDDCGTAALGCDSPGYDSIAPVFMGPDAAPMGARSQNGRIWGSYLHGLFDADLFRRWWIDRLRVRAGQAPLGRVVVPYDLEPAFDRLADAVRRSLRIEDLYRMMGLR